ncbi:putative ABC transporter [Trypanosoma grayi]|uniref:putative ABC transporter n=1 Tax=Trypanosoma grayi TaxID=71804 RepID=UPI0004F40814|nr:putative ABC transporter [Trypanosoma grayi]KEG10555.1 putative ABC transporter [Trypanosoma grayi]
MLRVLMKTGTSDGSCGGSISEREEGTYVDVTLNWNNGEAVRVPALVFDDDRLSMTTVFNVYCGLRRNKHPDALLLCDCWNCLMAVMERNLRRQIGADGAPLLDEVRTEELLALCTLLRGKYAIDEPPASQRRNVVVHSFPEELFQCLSNAYRNERSTRLGVTSFAMVVFDACSIRRLIGLAVVLLLSPDAVFKTVFGVQTDVNWIPLYIAEMQKVTAADLPAKDSVFRFIQKHLQGKPGTLAAIAVASIGPIELLYCLRDITVQYALMDLVMSFRLSAYLALSTADYVPDDNWALSQRVSNALWQASSSVMGELQNQVPCLLHTLYSLWVALRFPLMALAMWVGTQWGDLVDFLTESLYLESQHAKSYFVSGEMATEEEATMEEEEEEEEEQLESNIDESSSRHTTRNDRLNSTSPIQLLMRTRSYLHSDESIAEGRYRLVVSPNVVGKDSMAHHGLTLLVLVCIESKMVERPPWILLIRHVSWPISPRVYAVHIVQALDQAPRGDQLAVGLQKLQWVKTVIKNTLETNGKHDPHVRGSSQRRREYIREFTTLRQGGVELAAAKTAVNYTTLSKNGSWEDSLRDVFLGAFRTANAMPLLLASLAVLYVPQGYLEQTAFEQNNVMLHLRFIQHLFPLFPSLIGLFFEENGLSEAQVDIARIRRDLAMSGSSLGCYQVLKKLQSLEQKIDRPVPNPHPPMEGAWRIEFCDVSFRYSENHPYILWRVSFTIDKGTSLGIAGYSGAGKTTLLRLLNRTYTPTSGDIFINGFHIKQYPVRMIRRRIANVWQEENSLRFFNRLSIANNVALGNLWNSSEDNINAALSSAQALSFVQKRSSGIHSPLRVDEFSGGEVERLGIARAFMKRGLEASLYILDEATSAIDTTTEQKIFDFLGLRREEATSRHTTFVVVAHRLATLRHTDKILVLNDGRVEQIGSWEELCESEPNSCFWRMFRSQQLPLPNP